MKKKKASEFFEHSLLTKIMVAFIVIFVIPILVLYALLLRESNQTAISDTSAQIAVSLQNLSDTMDEIFTSVNFLQSQIQADPVFSDVSFSMLPRSARHDYETFQIREQVGRGVYQYYLSNSYVLSVEVYNPFAQAAFISATGNTRKIYEQPDNALILKIMGPDGRKEKQWFFEQTPDGAVFATYFSPFFSNNPALKLYVRITLPAHVVIEKFNTLFPDGQASLMLLLDNGQVMYLTQPQWLTENQPLQIDLAAEKGWAAQLTEGETFLQVHHRARYGGWYYLAYAPLSHFNSALSIINQYFYYFVACLILIFCISLTYIYTHVIRPMQVIIKKMRMAEQGNFDVRIYFKQKDELSYIGHRFNVLLKSVQTLIQENYETRMLKNNFELKFIQTQLKEHFIYNTLDTIHWIADKHHVPQISQIIFNLSKFFRLSLNHGRDTVLVSEIAETLRCYLDLVNARMDHMIDYTIYVEQGIEGARVVKYLFQPVIENAFQHGIREMEQGKIHISFEQVAAGRVKYTVTDNGIGMSPERLAQVLKYIRNDDKTGAPDDCFALINIKRQLKLYFGEDHTFEIESDPGQGTKVTLIFPSQQEERHVQADYY